MKLYPWQQSTWQQLMQRQTQLPHAILLHGASGIGKLGFAQALINSLLCVNTAEDGHACGQCQSCHWLEEGAHPDLKIVTQEMQDAKPSKNKPAKKKQHILIHQVRQLADFVNLTSHQQSGKRVVLIYPAQALNQAASNALLKMLEEPSGEAMFILVTDQLQRLLPTVLSRCVKFNLPLPSTEQATAWLKDQGIKDPANALAYHAGAPLAAASSNDHEEALAALWQLLSQGPRLMPAELAAKMSQLNIEQAIIVLQKWLYDLGLHKQTGKLRYHPSMMSAFSRLTENMPLSALQTLQKQLESLRKLASHPLNHELQLEALLLEYTRLFIQ